MLRAVITPARSYLAQAVLSVAVNADDGMLKSEGINDGVANAKRQRLVFNLLLRFRSELGEKTHNTNKTGNAQKLYEGVEKSNRENVQNLRVYKIVCIGK